MRFEGKTVLVTGAAPGGMGEATATLFAKDGAQVAIVDIDAKAAGDVAAGIRDAGGMAKPFQADLRNRAQVFETVREVAASFGGLDILANVAGIYPQSPAADMTEEFFDNVLAVDLKGPIFTCQAALPHISARGGAIVNVASGAAFYGIGGLAAYSAAKAGLIAFSRVLAIEARPRVRVNVVVPGSMWSPRRADAVPKSEDVPLTKRAVMPSQVAAAVLWCASAGAGAVDGAFIRVGARQML